MINGYQLISKFKIEQNKLIRFYVMHFIIKSKLNSLKKYKHDKNLINFIFNFIYKTPDKDSEQITFNLIVMNIENYISYILETNNKKLIYHQLTQDFIEIVAQFMSVKETRRRVSFIFIHKFIQQFKFLYLNKNVISQMI